MSDLYNAIVLALQLDSPQIQDILTPFKILLYSLDKLLSFEKEDENV